MIHKNDTLSDLLHHNPLLELVLDRFELSYQQGDTRIALAVKDKFPDVDFFIEILRVFDDPDSFDVAYFRSFPIRTQLDYLRRTHRYYLDKRLGEIERSVEQLMNKHEEIHTSLLLLAHIFDAFKYQLISHISLEEEAVFPYIEGLIRAKDKVSKPTVSLQQFVSDHEDEDLYQRLIEIRNLIIEHHPNVLEYMSFRILMAQLDAFSRDLSIHERLEEEVLIPRALELEKFLNCGV